MRNLLVLRHEEAMIAKQAGQERRDRAREKTAKGRTPVGMDDSGTFSGALRGREDALIDRGIAERELNSLNNTPLSSMSGEQLESHK
ncbi:MAG: hypothetical protein KAG66_09310, partial [Methylococcales bacterium]|nr:hypothetical protein [Methylococcales bacterium]